MIKAILLGILLTLNMNMFAQEETAKELYLGVHAQIRLESAKVLGEVNTIDGVEALIELGEMEFEPMVLSEIITGISKNTTADPEVIVNSLAKLMEANSMVLPEIISRISRDTTADLEVIVNSVARLLEVNGSAKDNDIAYAFLLSVENLVENNIEITNKSIIRLIAYMTLPDSGYIDIVSYRALDVLRSFK